MTCLKRSHDKQKPVCLYYHSAYGHQTWQVGDLPWGCPILIVTSPLVVFPDDVTIWKMYTSTFTRLTVKFNKNMLLHWKITFLQILLDLQNITCDLARFTHILICQKSEGSNILSCRLRFKISKVLITEAKQSNLRGNSNKYIWFYWK